MQHRRWTTNTESRPGLPQNSTRKLTRSVRGSAQISVAGADHFFNGMDNELVRNVKLFLDRNTR